jgi:hypothetical protein
MDFLPKPVSRTFLRGAHARFQEQMRMQVVNQRVTHVYNHVLHFAKTNPETRYSFLIEANLKHMWEPHINDILVNLTKLFPECSVDYTYTLAVGSGSYIVIDWS